MVEAVNLFNHNLIVGVRDNRKHRPEDFFLHYCIIVCHITHDDRRNLQPVLVRCAADNSLIFIYKSKNAVKMLLVDYLSIVGIVKRLGAELPYCLMLKIFYEFLIYAAVAENIVGCNAGLPTV